MRFNLKAHLLLALAAILSLAAAPALASAGIFDEATVAFAKKLDLSAVEKLGVQEEGRVTILDSFAREQLSDLTGQETPDGLLPSFACLELYFNPAAYLNVPLVQVREKALREKLLGLLPPEEAKALEQTHRLAVQDLLDEAGLTGLQVDLRGPVPKSQGLSGLSGTLRTAMMGMDFDPALRRARQKLEVRYSRFIARDALKLIPAQGEGDWLAVEELATAPSDLLRDDPNSSYARQLSQVHQTLLDLSDAWRKRDAQAANELLRRAVAQISALAPGAQPSPGKAAAELLYNRLYRFTLAWVGYAAAFLLLLAAVVQPGRRPWRWTGLGVLSLATAMLLIGFGIRWWLSGRAWYLPPVMNQFESVTTAAMLGSVMALALEAFFRKTYFALGASFFAAAALLCGYLLPHAMGAEIQSSQGILNNWILPLHVGTIILGYSMIGISLIISVVYLVALALRKATGAELSAGPDLTLVPAPSAGILVELDRCNLIVVQLACTLVGLGTILGAYWADYSWGRWWGFDAKETWALITWIVYLGIVHLRHVTPARTRGRWTAALCLAGAAVMLFNWVIVKYLLPSLHGYA